MMRTLVLFFTLFLASCATDNRPTPLFANTTELNTTARASWQEFVATNDAARTLSNSAEAVLIFPNIVEASLIAGGAYGDGVLIKGNETLGYYSSGSASWGFQAGAKRFGYALVFTNASALDYIDASEGWEIGVGPSIVVADEGLGANLSSTTLRADVYAFVYGQQGLQAGVNIEGTKITPRVRDN